MKPWKIACSNKSESNQQLTQGFNPLYISTGEFIAFVKHVNKCDFAAAQLLMPQPLFTTRAGAG
jgi:hypothetical protein